MKVKAPVYDQWYVNEGRGEVVILLHGMFGNLKMWTKTVEVLKRYFQVIVPRLPIFDESAGSSHNAYGVEVLHEFVSWHKLTDVTLVGHGSAAQLALLYARKYPVSVKRLVISGGTGFQSRSYFSDSEPEGIDYKLVEEKVQQAFYTPELASPRLVDEIYTKVQRAIALPALGSQTVEADTIHAAMLNKIDHPVLLLWGLEDKITPPEVAMHFQDFLQNSVIHFIDQCGHVPMVEQPDTYNWHLKNFIEA